MKRRVVVTGLGAVTPVGNTVEEFWSSVREGKVGIGPITKFDTSEYKVKLAAEVKGFSAKERMDFKAAKRMEPFAQYAVAAAKEAFEDAKIDMSQENPYRAGVIVGSGIGSLQAVETNYEKILRGRKRILSGRRKRSHLHDRRRCHHHPGRCQTLARRSSRQLVLPPGNQRSGRRYSYEMV